MVSVKYPGVNFTNIFCAAFTHTDAKSTKKTDSMTVFLRFSEYGCVIVKASRNTLVKLTPDSLGLKPYLVESISYLFRIENLTLSHNSGKKLELSGGVEADEIHAPVATEVAAVEPVPVLELVPRLPP